MINKLNKIALMLACIMMLSLHAKADVTPTKPEGNGIGISSTPYLVSNLAELLWVKNLMKEGYYDGVNRLEKNVYIKLTADIDLSPVCGPTIGSWEPITSFWGQIDGDGHQITNLYINRTDGKTGQGLGFIAYTGIHFGDSGRIHVIKNLTISGNVKGYGFDGVGMVVGSVNFGAMTMENVTVTGTVEGDQNVGGFVGTSYQFGPEFVNCTNYAEVVGSKNVGGLCGKALNGGTATGCKNYGAIKWKNNYTVSSGFGGIFGESYGIVTDCINNGTIDGMGDCGGIVGTMTYGDIAYCVNNGNVSSSGGNAGGIAGLGHAGTIKHCYNNEASIVGSRPGLILGRVDSQLFYQNECVGNGGNGTTYYKKDSPTPTPNCIGTSSYSGGEFYVFTAEEMASGYAAYTLQGSEEKTYWVQDLSDPKSKPTLKTSDLDDNTNRVYLVGGTYNCSNQLVGKLEYSNDPTPHFQYISHTYNDGFCTVCACGMEPTQVDGVYQIATVSHLAWFAHQLRTEKEDINAVLTANIDMTSYYQKGYKWTPIPKYRGHLDGQGYTISHFRCEMTGEKTVGFIKYLNSGGSLSNLTIEGQITCESDAGMLVGLMWKDKSDDVTITNCCARGTIAVQFSPESITIPRVAGIAGYADDKKACKIEGCTNYVNITAKGKYVEMSGICTYFAKITRCTNYGTLDAQEVENDYSAGICINYCDVDHCANFGEVKGNERVAGITYRNTTVNSSLNAGNISSKVSGGVGAISYYPLSNTFSNIYYSTSVKYTEGGTAITPRGNSANGDSGNVGTAYYGLPESDFADGSICLKLNQDAEHFGQQLGHDAYPIPGGMRIFRHYAEVCNGTEYPIPGTEYLTNSAEGLHRPYGSEGHHYIEEGRCVGHCGIIEAPKKDQDGYYTIEYAPHLVWLSNYVNSAEYKANPETVLARQTKNISLKEFCHPANEETGETELNWEPIGKNGFIGEYDGGSHWITDLYINNSTANYQGLFGEVGAMVGKKAPDFTTKLHHIKIHGNITANNYVGLIAGYMSVGEMYMCLTGRYSSLPVVRSKSNSSSGTFIGGLVGKAGSTGGEPNSSIHHCFVDNVHIYSESTKTYGYVGGIVGRSYWPLSCCQSTDITIEAKGTNQVGGIVGSLDINLAYGTMGLSECGATATIKAKDKIGVLAGQVTSACTIENSFAKVTEIRPTTPSTAQYVKPTVGYNSGNCTFSNTYYTGYHPGLEDKTTGVKSMSTGLVDLGELAVALGGHWGQRIDCVNLGRDITPTLYAPPAELINGKCTNLSLGLMTRAIQNLLECGINQPLTVNKLKTEYVKYLLQKK